MMKTEYFNNLPHFQPIGSQFFITFRLYDSLPMAVIEQLRFEHEQAVQKLLREKNEGTDELVYEQNKRHFAAFDRELDSKLLGNYYLRQPEVAKIIVDKIHKLDKKLYSLIAYSIMPNHVHLVIDTFLQIEQLDYHTEIDSNNYVQLHNIMRRIKGGSAYEINQVLDRTGKFWQKESYGHYVRNQKELQNIIRYTLQNPVKAGLVKEWQDWPFSYVNEAYL